MAVRLTCFTAAVALALLTAVALGSRALAAPVHGAHVTAELAFPNRSVQPGLPFTAGIDLKVDPGWHVYWINPGDAGLPTTVIWKLPKGFTAGPLQFPYPQKLEALGATNYGYANEVLLPVQLHAPADLLERSAASLAAHASWLVCAQVCVPGEADLSATVPAGAATPDPTWAARFATSQASLPRMIPGWQFAATTDLDGYGLTAQRTGPGAEAAGPFFFFSEDGQVLESGADQPVRSSRGILTAHLARFASTPLAQRLRGVWVAQGGWQPGLKAARIDVAVASGPSITPQPGGVAGLLPSLLLALLGGSVLNLMPCVFPVLGLKILGFARQSGQDRRHVVLHGLSFTAGVLVSFWALAALLEVLRAGGEQLGWGFQLQSPAFVFTLSAVMLAFALNLSGVFEFGLAATRVGGAAHDAAGLAGTFLTGLLATLVATPCSAPFLAPALGAAMALPIVQSFLLFTAIGIGLSLPYLLLSAFPGAVRALPRPGRWMESFRQALAFPLYATCAYLLWVLAGQLPADGLLNAAWGLVFIAMGLWAYGRWSATALSRRGSLALAAGLLIVLAGGGTWLGWPRADASAAAGQIAWQPWSPEAVDRARAENRVVYVDFTARWCATCQANKKLVFHSGRVLRLFARRHVAALRADWTSKDPAVTAELARYHRGAIPFNLVYQPGQSDPAILPELLTPQIVLDAVSRG